MKHTHSSRLSLAALALAGILTFSACGNSSESEPTTGASAATRDPAGTDLTDEQIVTNIRETASRNAEYWFTDITEDRNLHIELLRDITEEGETRSNNSAIDIHADKDNQTLKIESSRTDGETRTEESTSYFEYDGDVITVYTSDSDAWNSTELPANQIASTADVAVMDTSAIYSYVAALTDATVTRNANDSYTLVAQLTPDSLNEIFGDTATAEAGTSGTLTVSVDAQTFELYDLTLELEAEITDSDGRSSSVKMIINATAERDPDVDLEIPAEVLEAAGDSADSGDN